MSVAEFLSLLAQQGIELHSEGGRLQIRAKKGVLTPALLTELAQRKADILAFLQNGGAVAAETRSAPLSFLQQRLWFLEQLQPNSPAYNIPVAVQLRGDLDTNALAKSLNEILRRHQVLRTTVLLIEGQPVQRVLEPQPLSVPVVDLQSVPAEERQAEAHRKLLEASRRPFDLTAEEPLLRVLLVQLAAQEYVLVLTTHHFAADGWSVRVLVQELVALYAAFSTGRSSPLPELPIQYADYARRQSEPLHVETQHRQLTYWKQQLAGAPPVLELPGDRPRPAVQSFQGAQATLHLPLELSQALEGLSRREGSTLFMTLLAAFQTFLQRYTGQTDIVVATAISNRSRLDMEPLIGPFSNNLLLRTDLNPHLSFQQLLKQVRTTALEAFAHQDLPFERLVEELQPERNLSYNPLFQVVFTLQNAPLGAIELPGLSLNLIEIDSQTAKFDLNLSFRETAQGLAGILEYNTDLFEAETVRRMLAHFEHLLASIVAQPTLPIAQLNLLAPHEQHQLLTHFNPTPTDYPKDTCIQQQFEQQALITPQAIALVFADKTLTYQQLNEQANQLAHHLQTLGVGPEVTVAVYLERSFELVVALLATLKAGGIYLPLDPKYPQERTVFLLGDAKAAVVLAQQSCLPMLSAVTLPVVCLDGDDSIVARQSIDNPTCATAPDNLAYLVYTSGSTGTPKAVAAPHKAVLRLVLNTHYTQFDSTQTFLQLAPVTFDAATFEVWGPLLNGAKLVLAPAAFPSLQALGRLIQTEGITILWLTAGLFHQMVEFELESLRGVRQLLAGGDVLSAAAIRRCLDALPDCTVINGYGPTENTTFTCCHAMTDGPVPDSVPIGVPIANTQVYVLDAVMQLVPVGVAGELYVGGEGLARGYLGQAELTAERFVPDPFSSGGARLYRTGDRVRWHKDGVLEFLGRFDYQVKVRGHRIELGEIEVALQRHPAVGQVVVTVHEDVPGDRRLIAYVAAGAGQKPSVEALRQFLLAALPTYLLPAAFVVMETFPLTANGKVDRRALPLPEVSSLEPMPAVPRTPIEELLVDIWSTVLGLKQAIGVHANFFELGGHSLLVTQVVSRVRTALGVELPLRSLFEAPTVAALAEYIEVLQRSERGLTAPPLRPVERGGNLLLSFAQQRLWFLDQLVPGNPFYNVPAALRLQGLLDVTALERSIGEVVGRHELLRTTFTVLEGQPVPVIAPTIPFALSVIDYQKIAPDEREAAVRQMASQEAQHAFNLTVGPLLRATLLTLSEREHVLLLTMHHIVSDGWSIGVLIRELGALYAAFTADKPSPLPDLPLQYTDFAHWQRTWLAGEVLAQQLHYWKAQLTDVPALKLPTDRPRPAVQTFRGSHVSLALPEALGEALRALSRRTGATLYMTLLAAFGAFLQRYTGQADLCFGSPIANRNRSEIEGLIGFFVNSLVMRIDLSGNPTFETLLDRVRKVTLDAYAHQDLPFEKLVEELQPERDLSRNPLFQVVFALQNAPASDLKLPGLDLALLEVDSGTTRFDLELHVWERSKQLQCQLVYSTDLFEAETVRRMLAHFEHLLASIVAQPTLPIAQLKLLPPHEQHQLLTHFNPTPTDYPKDTCIQQQFEQQVLDTPDATALVFAGEQLTYRQLNEQANQLAHHLQTLGVGPEVTVAVYLERSFELIIALLAILKAGGVYLPLDPQYPRERTVFLLRDAKAAVVLTQQSCLPMLSALTLPIVCLNRDASTIAGYSTDNPTCATVSDNLAYLVYTSGSTGTPKAVAAPHKAVLRLVLNTHYAQFDSEQTFLQLAPVTFDAATFEVWGPLLNGAKLVLAPAAFPSLQALGQLIQAQGITILWLTTGLFHQMVEFELESLRGVRQLLTGGDVLSVAAVRRCLEALPGCTLSNFYGPTENTTFTCCHAMTDSPVPDSVPIGVPIANTRMYVLDTQMQLVPVGVAGELYVGGEGLARGYLGQAELTAERFIPDPFSSEGARLYRTGDRVRWSADGVLEFLGRLDYQVKVRGHRIELGEIEVVLAGHPAVQESVVLAREDVPGDQRLVAYVTEDGRYTADREQNEKTQLLAEQVSQWQMLFDDHIYSQPATGVDPTFNIVGWNSTYTGAPIPADEMRVWLKDRVEHILALKPQRVLEIGCGTGLMLFQIAPYCTRYVGTDFSQVSLDYVQRQLDKTAIPQVSLDRRTADDFAGFEPGSFDAVIINSVVQYFPNIEYLLRVIEGAVRSVAPGGFVFIGDVRNLPLLQAFHAAVQLRQAEPTVAKTQLQQRLQAQLLKENELVIDPAFFAALSTHLEAVSAVQILLMRGCGANELTQFRYNTILHVGATALRAPWLDWQYSELSVAGVRQILVETEPEILGIARIPNARVQEAVATAAWLADEAKPATAGEWRQRDRQGDPAGVDPEDLWALAEGLPYRIEIGWSDSGSEGRYDLLCVRRDLQGPVQMPLAERTGQPRPWSDYANNPLQARLTRMLTPALRQYLEERLPDYMIPSAFVVLDRLPLTANGKINRRALGAPVSGTGSAYVAPRNAIEEVLALIWIEVLALKQVGVHDNFFELGGHSLLVTQVVSRVRDAFGIELPLRTLFEAATVAGLALKLIEREVSPGQVTATAQLRQKLRGMSPEARRALLLEKKKAKARS